MGASAIANPPTVTFGSGGIDAFLYSGSMTDLGSPGEYSNAYATGINDSGQVVGCSYTALWATPPLRMRTGP